MGSTMAVSDEVKEEIKSFGVKGETYDAILRRLVEIAKEKQLQMLLMDESNTDSVANALERAKAKWQK
ncbi:MAG: hypothetical protein Q8P05_01705 [Candidatus Diapherotrites archaeon]|nr:hypothetical protein [Candidatus Diapherotrites archaeon]